MTTIRTGVLALVVVVAGALLVVVASRSESSAGDVGNHESRSLAAAGSIGPDGPAASTVVLRPVDEVERTPEPSAEFIDSVVSGESKPIRPQEEGPLPIAPKCLRDPFYNPEGTKLSPAEVNELQRVIEQLNRELAKVSEERSEILKSEVERRFRENDWVPEEQAARLARGRNVIYRADRSQVGSPADSAQAALTSQGARTVLITSGEIPRVDELAETKRILARSHQDTLRDLIAGMLTGR